MCFDTKKARSCDLAFLFLITKIFIFDQEKAALMAHKKRTSVKKNAQFVSENLVGQKSSTKTGTVWCIVQKDVDGLRLMRA